MYLKSIELVGFKSFAERTRLQFEPGMTAVVGPNGCGKSNISDAVRWVLGEQSAKALRGSKMEDCIFNGTDTHKPLGMAEVTLELADCEKSLGTEYNEVTVTRRVFRTGEGQYFINKTPCRLKDIQRLFMDTGISTNSYSLMEQGRIDRILSSRPEDRREVFEEASGITKFKADKKEAIRKLEHTEANLLRLADIIREVRRQIISLQRQAGKARRYKTLLEQLRGYDIYATRERINVLNDEIKLLETRLASVSEREEALRVDVEESEQQAAKYREELAGTEQSISAAMEASVQAKTELDRARELIRINQDRIRELKELSERDSRDAEEARGRLEQHTAALAALTVDLDKAAAARDSAEKELAEKTTALARHDEQVDTARRQIHDMSGESVDLESRAAHLQNELYALEAQERTNVIRRERLAAEQGELQRAVESYEGRQAEMAKGLEQLREEARVLAARVGDLESQRTNRAAATADLQKTMAEVRAQVAARKAQVELMSAREAEADGFPGGARLLLDPASALNINRSAVLGSLAERIRAEAPYRKALETALRAWLDAVIIRDSSFALQILSEIERRAEGSVRLLSVEAAASPLPPCAEGPGERLIDHVACDADVRPLVERLLHNVRVVPTLSEVPQPVPQSAVYVTAAGALIGASGIAEYWMPEAHEVSPLARHHLLDQWNGELESLVAQRAELDQRLAALAADESSFETAMAAARAGLDDARHRLAQREGEDHVISQEARQARERAETVAWEHKVLSEQQDSGGDQRAQIQKQIEEIRQRQAEIRSSIASRSDQLRELEQDRAEKAAEETDYRVRFAERRQAVEHLLSQQNPMQARIRELDELVRNRSAGIGTYKSRMDELQVAVNDTELKLQPLQETVTRYGEQLEQARRVREEKMAALAACDSALHDKRGTLEEVRKQKSHMDIEVAEQRIRRQNVLERITADYHITPELMAAEPEPAWENGQKPDRDTLETMIAEIRAKLESMGPVNLVAIDEHRELEERHAFLTQQQDDLVNAKQQLMDLIRKINKTTTEMFSQTFEQVNRNFQEMFKKLFGGGSAKLVLVDETDVLESGIEIIARPPGKKLQTVSLLSGGERTMTAVALLFSLYMVKPSPFCLLDELDAALDEANIGRFIKMVQGFLTSSQFLVITHNRQTISAADVLYGVTMEQNGVSKIVSVKFSQHEKRTFSGPPRAEEPAPASQAAEPEPDTATAVAVAEEPEPAQAPEAQPPPPAEAPADQPPA